MFERLIKKFIIWYFLKQHLTAVFEIDNKFVVRIFSKDFYNNDVTEALREYRFKAKWINVNDELPEKSGRYLTTVYNNKGEVDVFDLWFDDSKWYIDEDDDLFEFNVTHWMPLPQPPKGE